MKIIKRFIILILIGLITCNISLAAPKIILKLDDIKVQKGICPSIPAMDLLKKKKVKAGFGVVASRFDSTAVNVLKPYLNATNAKGEKLFEIWNHGLYHVKMEFKGTDYTFQKEHFTQADQLIKNLLGIQMHSFGTPGNASDSVTNQIISEFPEYKVFMFSSVIPQSTKGLIYLNNMVNMENGTGNIDYKYLLDNYEKHKNKYTDYMILQGHPNQWTPEKLEQFKLIIEFLQKEGCEFVLPQEYYSSLNSDSTSLTK